MSANNKAKMAKNQEISQLLKLYKMEEAGKTGFEKQQKYVYTDSGGISMILLRANAELQQTFEKLIQATKVPVKWNGIFAVVDNYMILQGEVRSLFFHFDSRKVATNIIEIPEQTHIEAVDKNLRVQNAINMILYAFGKWGTIKGIRVEKDYAQLNQLFAGIMQEYEVEPEYTPEYMRFYRSGVRITYEDVIQMAIEYSDMDESEEEVHGQGLWRKIVWKKAKTQFTRLDTTVEERKGDRLGNNFYMVGYLCPICGKNLHMVVYPEGKEFRIETEEGGVLLARAATCAQCQCFFTPRPKKLFAEGDIYVMEFGEDTVAYEDYMELLGRDGDRVSNCHCNEYADGRDCREENVEESLEELYTYLPELPEEELRKLEARMEEGFYPDESILKYEHAVKEQAVQRRMMQKGEASLDLDEERKQGQSRGYGQELEQEQLQLHGRSGLEYEKDKQSGHKQSDSDEKLGGESQRRVSPHSAESGGSRGSAKAEVTEAARTLKKDGKTIGAPEHSDIIITPEESAEVRKKYEARINVLERYSERQLKELKSQLERERKLSVEEREAFLVRVEKKLEDEQTARLSEKVAACEGKNYVVIKRMREEVEHAPIPYERKEPLFEKLNAWKVQQAEREVRQLIEKMPKDLDRNQYKQYVQRIRDYEDVDFSPFEEVLKERRGAAEKQEIANVVKRARKVSREDLTELSDRLREGDYLPELVLPYIEKVEERIKEMDAEAIALICPNPMQMTFAQGIRAYEQIEQGDFLPELKQDALKQLTKRLAKIKTDECELLVQKLREELQESGVADNPRHHFYPARKALLKQAKPEEVEVIEYAMASYAAGKGLFEYPILVVDATRNGTGKEGIILTPDHLYYSTLLNAYGMQINTISRIEGSTGLLNKGLYVYQKNGTKTKLPYAVESKELGSFAKVLDSFVHYLQEKPDSRSLTYLASEKHETICCFRCGYEYKGGNVCPKCGYQNNE